MPDYKKETSEAIAKMRESEKHLSNAPKIIHLFCSFYADAVFEETELTPAAYDNWFNWYLENLKGGYARDWDNITISIDDLLNQSSETYQLIESYKLKIARAVFSEHFYQEYQVFLKHLNQNPKIEL